MHVRSYIHRYTIKSSLTIPCECLGNIPLPLLVMFPSSSINLAVNNFNLSMKCIPEDSGFYYKWEKQNGTLPSRAQGIYSSHLVIFNLRAEDAGKYQCIYSNTTGKISSMYRMLTVKGMICTCMVIYKLISI